MVFLKDAIHAFLSNNRDMRRLWYHWLNVDHNIYSIKYYCQGDLNTFLDEVSHMATFVPVWVGFEDHIIFHDGHLCIPNLIPWEKEGF